MFSLFKKRGKKMVEPKFKFGQEVYVSVGSITAAMVGIYKGIIKNYFNDGWYLVNIVDLDSNFYYPEVSILPLPEEDLTLRDKVPQSKQPKELKVGDKVRVIDYQKTEYIGFIGTVISIRHILPHKGDVYIVDLPYKEEAYIADFKKSLGGRLFTKSQLELVEDECESKKEPSKIWCYEEGAPVPDWSVPKDSPMAGERPKMTDHLLVLKYEPLKFKTVREMLEEAIKDKDPKVVEVLIANGWNHPDVTCLSKEIIITIDPLAKSKNDHCETVSNLQQAADVVASGKSAIPKDAMEKAVAAQITQPILSDSAYTKMVQDEINRAVNAASKTFNVGDEVIILPAPTLNHAGIVRKINDEGRLILVETCDMYFWHCTPDQLELVKRAEPKYMSFSEALQLLKQGKKVARKEWKEKFSNCADYYIYMKDKRVYGSPAGYISHINVSDLLANDWYEVE